MTVMNYFEFFKSLLSHLERLQCSNKLFIEKSVYFSHMAILQFQDFEFKSLYSLNLKQCKKVNVNLIQDYIFLVMVVKIKNTL